MANSWWDDIKDLFKTKKQKAAEENEKVNNALRRESQITGQLKALEDEYNKNNPAAPDPDFDEIFKPVCDLLNPLGDGAGDFEPNLFRNFFL